MTHPLDERALEAAARALCCPDFHDDKREMNLMRHDAHKAITAYLEALNALAAQDEAEARAAQRERDREQDDRREDLLNATRERD